MLSDDEIKEVLSKWAFAFKMKEIIENTDFDRADKDELLEYFKPKEEIE